MKFERYGIGIAKGMMVTLRHLARKPVTTQYPEERLNVSRRIRGNELAWDKDKCVGCYTCSRSCPHGCIDIRASVTGKEGAALAPCRETCPAGVDAARYVRLIAEGKPAEALAVVREKLVFPSACGHICAHPCEGKCNRGLIDEPIAIRILKRYAWEHDTGLWKSKSKVAPPTGKLVAVVGAGPGGLAAAYYLAKLGHKVTVFEALPEPGGMMRYGIPEYRLPKAVLRDEIKEIENVGVEIRIGVRVESTAALTAQGYSAIFLAIGAQQAVEIGVSGEDSPRVMGGVDFLRRANMGEKVPVGDRVAIVGGGNTAMDSARTARRLGAKEVVIVYRRTRAEMPASAEELHEALEEGSNVLFLAAPSKIAARGVQVELECIRMKLGALDASGRRRPEPVKGSEFTTVYDTVVAAIGQRSEKIADFDVKTGRGNVIEADSATLVTSKPGVYAGGDGVSGPATVIEAVAAGRKAASSIDKYLGGKGVIDEVLAPVEAVPSRAQGPAEGWRPEVPAIPLAKRLKGFDRVEMSVPEKSAVEEAKRCLRCDLVYQAETYQLDTRKCIMCGLCVESCPFDALFMGTGYERAVYRQRELVLQKEALAARSERQPSGYFHPEIEATLPRQTLLVDRDGGEQ
ncbi:MAG: FAD-dependent oxidoreductase [Chloroflexota bacterium]